MQQSVHNSLEIWFETIALAMSADSYNPAPQLVGSVSQEQVLVTGAEIR